MKLIATVFVSYLSIASVESLGFRCATKKTGNADAAATNAADDIIDEQRNLQDVPWCWVGGVESDKKWHPVYSSGWNAGHCAHNSDCNAPAYNSQIDCCNATYLNQVSGACLGSLPIPPTKTPTSAPTGSPVAPPPPTPPVPTPPVPGCWVGGVEPDKKWHPVYSSGWDAGHCAYNSDCDAPAYDSQLDCCTNTYLNQASSACLGSLPNPPTKTLTSAPSGNPVVAPTSPTPPAPTPTDGTTGFWYPDYQTSDLSMGVCKNAWPLPYENEFDRPNYPTQLECCQAAYGGQMSGACLEELPNPPTNSPTIASTGSPVVTPPSPTPPTPPTDGTAGFWYPDYATNWFDAGCLNTWPLIKFNENDCPKYDTQLECCNQAYGGQPGNTCIAQIDP